MLKVIKLYNYPVRKISKCKMEHHKASLVNKLLGVSCLTEAKFSLSNNQTHFVNKQHVICLFVYLWFYVAFNTEKVISRRVVGRAEETST